MNLKIEQTGVFEYLKERGVDIPAGASVVSLENTGHQSDLLRQQNLYWREGYDSFHNDESGVYMSLPSKAADRNRSRYAAEAQLWLKESETRELQEQSNALVLPVLESGPGPAFGLGVVLDLLKKAPVYEILVHPAQLFLAERIAHAVQEMGLCVIQVSPILYSTSPIAYILRGENDHVSDGAGMPSTDVK